MSLLLNIESYRYKDFIEWRGAIIKVHHPDFDPLPEEGGIVVAPGTVNFLSVVKVGRASR